MRPSQTEILTSHSYRNWRGGGEGRGAGRKKKIKVGKKNPDPQIHAFPPLDSCQTLTSWSGLRMLQPNLFNRDSSPTAGQGSNEEKKEM